MNVLSFPEAVEIQTTSYCNGKCIICPHKDVFTKIPQGIMKKKLFTKIIDEINERKVLIIMYLNAEPLADADIFNKLDYVERICKNAVIEMSSNLSLLDEGKLEKLRTHRIDELRLSIFGFTEKTYNKMMSGLDWFHTKRNLDMLVQDEKLRKNIKKISLVMINFEDLTKEDISLAENYCKQHNLEFNFWGFLDRAGNVEKYSNDVKKINVTGCEQDRPLKRMHITFDGKVVLCCQDWQRQYVLGNVNTDSLLDIWHSDKYNKIREAIYKENGKTPELCKKCKLAR